MSKTFSITVSDAVAECLDILGKQDGSSRSRFSATILERVCIRNRPDLFADVGPVDFSLTEENAIAIIKASAVDGVVTYGVLGEVIRASKLDMGQLIKKCETEGLTITNE